MWRKVEGYAPSVPPVPLWVAAEGGRRPVGFFSTDDGPPDVTTGLEPPDPVDWGDEAPRVGPPVCVCGCVLTRGWTGPAVVAVLAVAGVGGGRFQGRGREVWHRELAREGRGIASGVAGLGRGGSTASGTCSGT